MRSVRLTPFAALLLLLGCSKSSTSTPTITQTCTDFWTARCAEFQTYMPTTFNVSYSSPAQCVSSSVSACVDGWSGPNVLATPAEVSACYQAYGSLDRSDAIRSLFDNNAIPAVAATACAAITNGALTDGATCNSPNECASGTCQRSAGAYCGKCVEPGQANAFCYANSDCAPGYGCTRAVCVPLGKAGDSCDGDTPCHSDLGCIKGICGTQLAAGATCDPTVVSCSVDGAYCDSANVCQQEKVVTTGQTCGYPAVETDPYLQCGQGARCNIDYATYAGVCVANAGVGEPCTYVEFGERSQCDPGLSCVDRTCQMITQAQCDDPATIPGAPFKEASRQPFPQVPDNGGPVLSQPQLVTITFSQGYGASGQEPYEFTSQAQGFGDYVMSSQWLTTVGKPYGVGQGAHLAKVVIDGPPPGSNNTVDDSAISTWIAAQVTAGVLPTPPDPASNQYIYMVYFPSTWTITLTGTSSCSYFAGYHSSFSIGQLNASYAVIADCQQGVDQVTITASHELIEAATDPYPNGNAAYVLQNYTNPFTFFSGEIGDLCNDTAITEGGFAMQRIWSNPAAAAGIDPCAPALPNTTFYGVSSSPTGVQKATAGQTYKYTITGYSSGPMADWGMFYNNEGDVTPTLSLDKDLINNGLTSTLTVGIPTGAHGRVVIDLSAQANGAPWNETHDWPIVLLVQ